KHWGQFGLGSFSGSAGGGTLVVGGEADTAGASPGETVTAAAGADSEGGEADRADPVRRSIAERTASGAPPLRAASKSGAAAPERCIKISGSGSMTGSSHGPWTMKGSSKLGSRAAGPVAPLVSRLAVPFRSSSRAGIEAEPVSASPTAEPS